VGTGNVVLIRHGETEWSATGQHTSRTDVDLTPAGEEQAAALATRLDGRGFGAVLCSPRRRARRTAELAGLTVTGYDDDLAEWDYGAYEGLTSAEIWSQRPRWSLWTDGGPDGETPAQVEKRVDRLLARLDRRSGDADVACVSHGHVLRVLAARWLGLGAASGALFALDPACVGELGFEHDRRVIRRWNC
jgi:probable phosphoglycerate mutase